MMVFCRRVLIALARADSGLIRTERALLAGAGVMGLLIVLFLLGVDILGWFGAEPAAE